MTTKKSAKEALEEILGEKISFSMAIRSARLATEMSLEDCAEILGISKTQLSDIEHKRRIISAAKAAEFAKKLGENPSFWAQLVWQDEADKYGIDAVIQAHPRKRKAKTLSAVYR